MKLLLIAILLLSDTSAVVDASKAAKEKRKKSSTKVITNSDVKKSKGKLSQTPGTAGEVPPAPESLVEKHEADRKARIENDAKRIVLEKEVADLERELARIEQSYYDENDLNRRDTVITARFAETKAKLDAAKKELDAVTPKPKTE